MNLEHFFELTGDIVKTQVVPANQLSLNILSLETFSSYTIDVAAMTVKGPGPNSRVHTWTMELSMLKILLFL